MLAHAAEITDDVLPSKGRPDSVELLGLLLQDDGISVILELRELLHTKSALPAHGSALPVDGELLDQ